MLTKTFGWQHCQSHYLQKNFSFLTKLGNFKQKFFWRQCHWQCCQSKVCSIGKSRWFRPLYVYMRVEANYTLKLSIKSCTTKLLVIESVRTMSEQCRNGVGTMSKRCRNNVKTMSKQYQNNVKNLTLLNSLRFLLIFDVISTLFQVRRLEESSQWIGR